METTNEELQSTNEELETTNEELQSTNEELETMNEELHSTNDELEAMNDEQRDGARELSHLNVFLEEILGNLGMGVVVLDQERHVQVWNAGAEEMWGVRPEETEGRPFAELDIGLPVEQLERGITGAMADASEQEEVVIDAVNRKGRQFACAVRAITLKDPDGNSHGVIVLMRDRDADGVMWRGGSRAPST